MPVQLFRLGAPGRYTVCRVRGQWIVKRADVGLIAGPFPSRRLAISKAMSFAQQTPDPLQLVAKPAIEVIAERGGRVVARADLDSPEAVATWIDGVVREQEAI